MRILLSGGGTAGHVVPILSVVSTFRRDPEPEIHEPVLSLSGQKSGDALPERDASGSYAVRGARSGAETQAHPDRRSPSTGATVELRYVGESGGIEETLAQRAGIPFDAVETGQIRGQNPLAVARSFARMARGARRCAALLAEFRPDVVFITGGYVTAPLAWAAWRRHTPLLIYLPDLTPGLAVRATSRLAQRVAVSFPEVARYFGAKAVVTGYPVRPELLTTSKASARAALGLGSDLPVLLVFGGSRGARSINQAVVAALPALLPRTQVVHISGQSDWPWVSEAQATLPAEVAARYHAYAYLHDEMVQALAAADLVIARAGASTLGEFPAVGLPSILAPYPYAGQHQHANADYLAGHGAAIIVEDAQLSGQLAPTVLQLLDVPGKLAGMAQAARALSYPRAAENIAAELRRLSGR